jgi:seryl-tRNA synthetase
MGWFTKDLVEREATRDLEGQVAGLIKEKRELTEKLEELKLKKRLEQEEIAHMQRINEERLKQELEQEKLKLQREHQEKITNLEEKTMKEINKSLVDFHSKMEKRFGDELANLKEVYGLLMQRLPNVNMEITKHIGDPVNTIEHKKGKH